MKTHLAMGRSSFTISVVCGIFASFSISPHGGLCGLTCSPSPVAPVQELVHQSTVVLEGKLQDEGREHDINREERERLRDQRVLRNYSSNYKEVPGTGDEHVPPESVPNRTDSERYQVRIKVHQVWESKTGGLVKDSIVYIVWNRGDNCLTLSKDTRYMFFMEPTNDTAVFNLAFPPVETRRSVRREVSKVLCKDCAEPRLKEMKSVTQEKGKKIVLQCEVRAGNPAPRIKWYKDGKELTNDNKLKDAKFKKRKKGKVSELHIRKAADVHAGSYTCEASNNLGKASAVGNVTLLHDHAVPQSTTPAVKTSSHVTRCRDSQKNYCVNGGECYTLEVTPGSTKFLCRCPNEFTGDRCQNYVMASFYKHLGIEFMAEELYQKRVLTITGICIALLVVGIMCVVAYCKTKKQRKKLHDRLRRSLRNERNNMAASGMANGPHVPNPPLENVQLVNQYVSKSAMPAQHVIEKETETSFSTSQYTSSAHQSTTVTHTSSQSWSNGQSESVLSDSRSILLMSSAESSRHATPSRRGRLNATGGARELGGHQKGSRDTPDSYGGSPYSERYVSAVTTPTRMSPVDPATPGSPPSEMSAPLSPSLAASIPSMAVSPSGEEERPLLFATPPRVRDKPTRQDHSQSKRNSAHYNHGLEAHSPPASPLRILEEGDYPVRREHEAAATSATKTGPAPPQSLPMKLANTNNNNARRAPQRTKANGHVSHEMESDNSDSSSSARSSSESETEDERVGEDTPFLSAQSAAAALGADAASVLRPADSSRTNPALRLSPQDDLQARLSSAIANQDPIAV